MIVMKFGGTSVGDADRISNVANIIKSHINKKPVVVVSAVGGITNKLIELGNAAAEGKGNEVFENIKSIHYKILEILELDKSLVDNDIENLAVMIDEIKSSKNIDNEILDNVQSFGEQMSSKIMAAQLNKIGVKAGAFNSWDLGFLTNSEFGNAEPLEGTYNSLNDNIKNLDVIPIVTGFIGKTRNGEITTLGRGGSDYSAAIIGSAINAEEIQIWTDVDGVMSTDPKVVSNAKTLDKISFAEASELAYFGARVLHPKTILPAMNKNIPVRVLNSFNPKGNGTRILNNAEKNRHLVRAVAYKKNIILINVVSTRMLGAYGFLARVFNIFDKYKKSVDVISTSEVSVSLTIDNENEIEDITNDIEEIARVGVLKNRAVVCIVGEHMMNVPGIAGRTFEALGKNNINVEMISQASSGVNITFVVDGRDIENAVKCLHEEYFS